MKQCMNFKFVILFALTLLVGSTVYGQDNVIDEVVWVVGDEAIPVSYTHLDVYKRQEPERQNATARNSVNSLSGTVRRMRLNVPRTCVCVLWPISQK